MNPASDGLCKKKCFSPAAVVTMSTATDHRHRTSLQLALLDGDFDLAERLIVEHRGNVDYLDNRDLFGFTSMHYAAEYQNVRLIRLLKDCGSLAINARSAAGIRPLDFARTNAALENAIRECDSDNSEDDMYSDEDDDRLPWSFFGLC